MNSKLTVKRALGAAWSSFNHRGKRSLVLLYHSVGDTPWAIRPAQFRAQIEWLCAHATILSLPQLLEYRSRSALEVTLTFDDGYESLHRHAYPILSSFGAGATVFVNSGCIAGESRRLSDERLGHYPGEAFLLWKEVNELARGGWFIGSHGVEHDDLTQADDAAASMELHRSRADIESRISGPCRFFAYTWGRHNERLRALTRDAGYECAFAAQHGPIAGASDRFALPRINIAADYSLRDFAAIVRGDWDYLGRLARLRARAA